MIVVTRLTGAQFGVNPDLIQRVECAPDTILTLVDGTKFIVRESLDEVIALVHEHRASLLARSRELEARGPLGAVPDQPDEPDEHEDERTVSPPVPLRPRRR